MSDDRYEISEDYVVLKTNANDLPGTVEILSDGDQQYVLIKKEHLSKENLEASLPALNDTQTGEPVVQTGKVIARWDDVTKVQKHLEDTGEAELERNYGRGGIIASKSTQNPIDFANELRKIEGVTKTEIQTLRPMQKK